MSLALPSRVRASCKIREEVASSKALGLAKTFLKIWFFGVLVRQRREAGLWKIKKKQSVRVKFLGICRNDLGTSPSKASVKMDPQTCRHPQKKTGEVKTSCRIGVSGLRGRDKTS